jgi:CPA1 family monovalent cation:H+ antiporter
VNILKYRREFSNNAIKIMTWSGLRGGISIALALSVPPGAARDLIVGITYVVVVFSILVQGLTIRRLVQISHLGPDISD